MCAQRVRQAHRRIELQRTTLIGPVDVLHDQADHQPDRNPPVLATATFGVVLSEERDHGDRAYLYREGGQLSEGGCECVEGLVGVRYCGETWEDAGAGCA